MGFLKREKSVMPESLRPHRTLEWVAFPFSLGSSQPGIWTRVSQIEDRFFTSWATREGQEYWTA